MGEPLGVRHCGLTAITQTVCGSASHIVRAPQTKKTSLYFQDSADGAMSLCQQVLLTVLPELALFIVLSLLFQATS